MDNNQEIEKIEVEKGRVISVISVKGGVGKTTTVANLGVLLSNEFGIRCLVVDGDLNLPNIGLHLGIIDPDITLHDVLMDKFSITQAVYIHDSGLHVIPGSVSGGKVSSQDIKTNVTQLLHQYQWIIIDTSPNLDENLRNMINSSDEVVVVSSPDFPSVIATLKAIKLADELKVPIRGIVLNKIRRKDYELTLKEIKSIINVPIIALIPEDPRVYEALSEKTPVTLYRPNSPATKEFRKLAAILIGEKEPRKGFFYRIIDSILGFLRK